MESYLFTAFIISSLFFILFFILYILQLKKTDFTKSSFDKLVQQLSESIESKDKVITDLKKSISDLNLKISALERKLSKKQDECLALQLENETLQQKFSKCEDEKNTLLNRLSELISEKDELQRAYDNIKNIIPDSGITEKLEKKQEVSSNPKRLDDQQAEIYKQMLSGKNMFITGKAGTGKSFLLRYYKTHTHNEALYAAPTGIAARNIEGSTLHSLFGFDNLLYGKLSVPSLSDKQINLFRKIDTLVIDEISMVSSGTFERLDEILQFARDNSLPFGGVQIILFGDLFQLPPVEKSKEVAAAQTNRFGGLLFFNSYAYKNGEFSFYELTEPHRQENDKPFLSILDSIRLGNVTKGIIDQLNERYYQHLGIKNFQDYCFSKRIVQLVPTNKQAIEITEKALSKITMEKLYVYKAININIDNEIYDSVLTFYKDVQAPEELRLKVGALIMMIKNDNSGYDRWANGTMGVVAALDVNSVSVAINKIVYQLSRESFDVQKAEIDKDTKKIVYRTVGSMEQFPLIPAYAITIHKAQGQTYNRLACDLSQCFTNGQAYVALSRCKTLDNLYLTSPIKTGAIKTDNNVINFYNEEKAKESERRLLS